MRDTHTPGVLAESGDFDAGLPFDRVSLNYVWSSEISNPDVSLPSILVQAILNEKRRAYSIEVLICEDDEDRLQAEELAQMLMNKVRIEAGRVTVEYGALEEDVGEWLVGLVA